MVKKPAKPKSFRDPVEPETRAERLLADCVLRGVTADVSGFEGDAEKEVRAVFLRYLCLNAENLNVDPRGILLWGAKISGVFDIAGATVDRSIWFGNCSFASVPLIHDASVKSISFQQSRLPGLNGDRLSVEGNFYFSGVTATGETRLLGAVVTGQLNCEGAVLKNKGKAAFSADALTVGGGLFLGGVEITGETRLLEASVKGQVNCVGATFTNSDGFAFNADGLVVEDCLFFGSSNIDHNGYLYEGATVNGGVRLVGSVINGFINCIGATFNANEADGVAFSGDGMVVAGDILFRNAKLFGETRIAGATVSGQFDCSGAMFSNQHDALVCQSLRVEGEFFWWRMPDALQGKMNLNHASVGVLVADGTGWPEAGNLELDGFKYGILGVHHSWRVILNWIELQPRGEFTPQPYEQAIKVYREAGHIADAREMGIAKMEAYRKYGDLSPAERVWLWIAGPLIKYGYKPWRALYYALVVFALSVFVFAYAFDAGHMEPSKERVYLHECYLVEKPSQPCVGWERPARWWVLASPYRLPADYPAFNPITYSLDTIIPIVDLHQESYWLPRDTKPGGWFFRAWHWLHIGLGWMLTTLFVTGLTGIVKKD